MQEVFNQGLTAPVLGEKVMTERMRKNLGVKRLDAYEIWQGLDWDERYSIMSKVQGSRKPEIWLKACLDYVIENEVKV